MLACALAAAVASALPGCSSNSAAPGAPAEAGAATVSQQLQGQVTLGSLVSGSPVRILNGDTEVASDTLYNGSYSVLTTPLSEPALQALRAEARACLDSNNDQSCVTLSAALPGKALGAVHRINVRSTLVDRLVRRNNYTQDAAEKRVSTYLMLDDYVKAQDPADSNAFSPARFVAETYREAQVAGASLDQQFDTLAGQLAADPELQRQYPPLLRLNPIVTGIGIELAKGAVGAVGGEIGGRILSSLGLASDNGDAQRHAELMAKFQDLDIKMNRLGAQIDQVQAGVNKTLQRLQTVDLQLQDAARQQLAQRLLTQTTSLAEYIEQVKTTMLDLQRAKYKDLKGQASERVRLKAVIEALLSKRTLISSTMNGAGGAPAMMTSMIESEFPKLTTADSNKEVFFGPRAVQAMQDFARYYDEINATAYILFINYYNALDDENKVATAPCPDTRVAGTVYSNQCELYFELKAARDSYLAQGPQENLPATDMFLAVNPAYKLMPYVIYPGFDANFRVFGANTGRSGQSAVPATMDMYLYSGMGQAQASEIKNMADWRFMDYFAWYGIFTRYSSGDKFLESVVARGAPASAFVTATNDRAAWTFNENASDPWQRVSTVTGFTDSKDRAFDNAKLFLYGQLKNRSDLERYMGKVIAARFQ